MASDLGPAVLKNAVFMCKLLLTCFSLKLRILSSVSVYSKTSVSVYWKPRLLFSGKKLLLDKMIYEKELDLCTNILVSIQLP